MAALAQPTAFSSRGSLLLSNNTSITVYRRSSTCKAPRKRLALLQLQKRSQTSVCTADAVGYEAGGNGPNGPTNNRPTWGRGDGDFSDGSNGRSVIDAARSALAVMLAGVALWAVQAGPAAATAAGEVDNTLDPFHVDSSMEMFQTYSPSAGDPDECVCGEGLTPEEKELLAPRQYRVREWVFVH